MPKVLTPHLRRSKTEPADAATCVCADPLRDYLEKLRDYPILSADEETAIAEQLRDVRRRLRRILLENPYMLAGAVDILNQVCQGQLRADRTLETTVFDQQAYREATSGLPQVVWRLQRVVARNRRDAARLADPQAPAAARHVYAQRLNARTRVAAPVAWETKLRLKALYPLLQQLAVVGGRVQCLEGRRDPQPEKRAELARLIELTGTCPRRLKRWLNLAGALAARYEALKHRLARHNLRLVVSVAKHYARKGPELLDLIQEGNAGLLRAVDKFEPLGYRFTTYATWWIRQAIWRSLLGESRLIALPREKVRTLHRLQKTRKQWLKQHGRAPTIEEEIEASGLSDREAQPLLKFDRPFLSLDVAAQDSENTLGDLVEADGGEPAQDLDREALSRLVNEMLVDLKERERQVIELRFGLLDKQFRTLDEVGKLLGVSGERVRQIERRAVDKLRSCKRQASLRAFLEP
ncbi:MAG TPA: sigma-70 family RNA polymerase sigma factor [Pirellulales bacterium]|nr:sigma-70 family RNA polymerase sigma factor [Pirellulales bacterium]